MNFTDFQKKMETQIETNNKNMQKMESNIIGTNEGMKEFIANTGKKLAEEGNQFEIRESKLM